MENDKINSVTNFFQYLLSAEILSELKIEFILPHLVTNFQLNERKKTNNKVPSNILHYTRSYLENGG